MYKIKRFQNWMKSQHQVGRILGEDYLRKANTSLLGFLQVYYDIASQENVHPEVINAVSDDVSQRLSKLPGYEALYKQFKSANTRLDRVIALDALAHMAHGGGDREVLGKVYDMDTSEAHAVATPVLDSLAGNTPVDEIRKYNRDYFSTLFSGNIELLNKQAGLTIKKDISDAIKEYEILYDAQSKSKDTIFLSDAELLTLYRYSKDSKYESMIKSRGLDEKEPLVVGGPASVAIIDKEDHLIRTEVLGKAFKKFMNQFRARNSMIMHSDVQIGWPLPAFINDKGKVFKSGIVDNGLYVISELRPDSEIADKVRKDVESGEIKSYSIAGSALDKTMKSKGDKTYWDIGDLTFSEFTYCSAPVNPEAHFEVLQKQEKQLPKVKSIKKAQKPDYIEKTIVKRGNKWAVVAESTGKTLGTHDSREDALRQLRAVEANKAIDGFNDYMEEQDKEKPKERKFKQLPTSQETDNVLFSKESNEEGDMGLDKQIKDEFAVATAAAKEMGYTDFSEGSEGRKKRDEIAEALKKGDITALDRLNKWLSKQKEDSHYISEFKDKLKELKEKHGELEGEHHVTARRHAASEVAKGLEALDNYLGKQRTPPRPGLVFDESKHRWVKATEAEEAVSRERKYPTKEDKAELANLYHLARTAGKESRHDRMIWATEKFVKEHPEWTKESAYKAVEEAISHGLVE